MKITMKSGASSSKTIITSGYWSVSLLALSGLSLLPAATSAGDWTSKDGYVYYSTPAAPEPGPKIELKDKASTPSFVLMGGGPDVDQAFRWMIERAGVRPASAGKPATGGRFVIVRATGADGYNPYIYYSNAALQTDQPAADDWVGGAQLGLSSVETLVIPDRAAADSDFVNQVVRSANAVFIAGGDQSDYIRQWKRTKLEASLIELMKDKVPIGGTSAGLAMLGQFDFSALRGSVTSTQALAVTDRLIGATS
jgi:cyanophycinase-like exopeptidase